MTKKEEYILKSDAIKAIQNDCLEQVYYTKEDAIAVIESCDVITLIEIDHEVTMDNVGNHIATIYKETWNEKS